MSDLTPSSGDGDNNKKTVRRNLPSWMSSRENENEHQGKKLSGDGESSEGEAPKMTKGRIKGLTDGTPSKQTERNGKSSLPGLDTKTFSKLLEGVVFVLSGFVNPERSILRSQALEMGAEYQPDWNSDCTLLVCAFPNTPKFRQVEADCGTIVSKDWILECYAQKKLTDIESYLMHAGRPWRRGNVSHETSEGEKQCLSQKAQKQIEGGSPSKPTASAKPKRKDVNLDKKCFSPSEVKKWASDDLNSTILWLESQEEKPDQSEITKIAAEGILTCLQDAISFLEQKKDIHRITEEWKFVPRVVEELAKLDKVGNDMASMSKEDLHRHAMDCKHIYEVELNSLEDERRSGRTKATISGAVDYDSDDTVEMTEEEIDLAYNTVASTIGK
ncbi:DNA-repair protein XRCC1 [Quillaja saponaria]|uniref:DNA-repair protein XRCC1 n=1 Tax=Quillaja saponaria TaxID=32244 RepID=A0AAD7PQB0_QUISA|nr:DNA-repair protein XRCC1 [Quillaja saponaria]